MPAPRAERVHGDVAALGDHRHRAGLERRPGRSPQIAARARDRDDPVAVRAADREVVGERDLAQLGLERAAGLDLAEPGREHDRAAAAALGGLARHAPATPAAGIATTSASTGSGRSATLGHAGAAVHLVALRVHAPDLPVEPGALEVAQHVSP